MAPTRAVIEECVLPAPLPSSECMPQVQNPIYGFYNPLPLPQNLNLFLVTPIEAKNKKKNLERNTNKSLWIAAEVPPIVSLALELLVLVLGVVGEAAVVTI
ncbi:hypothetical protein Fot_21279 [Forsythia ovata]|uniref:Uncharacterized protein n=1 Tax=Forsythia ovata TaxID=205694 RepID=A0ABD1UW99_9LAMI